MTRRVGLSLTLRQRRRGLDAAEAGAVMSAAGVDDTALSGVLLRARGSTRATAYGLLDIFTIIGVTRLLFDGPKPSSVLTLVVVTPFWIRRIWFNTGMSSGESLLLFGARAAYVLDNRGGVVVGLSKGAWLSLSDDERGWPFNYAVYEVMLTDDGRTWRGEISARQLPALQSGWNARRAAIPSETGQ